VISVQFVFPNVVCLVGLQVYAKDGSDQINTVVLYIYIKLSLSLKTVRWQDSA
jgi:hypothetical protein